MTFILVKNMSKLSSYFSSFDVVEDDTPVPEGYVPLQLRDVLYKPRGQIKKGLQYSVDAKKFVIPEAALGLPCTRSKPYECTTIYEFPSIYPLANSRRLVCQVELKPENDLNARPRLKLSEEEQSWRAEEWMGEKRWRYDLRTAGYVDMDANKIETGRLGMTFPRGVAAIGLTLGQALGLSDYINPPDSTHTQEPPQASPPG